MEKAVKIFAIVIVIELLLISTGIFLSLRNDPYNICIENQPVVYLETPVALIPRNHDISRVEDLFIAFEYEHNTSCTFVMTENFTELSIVLQHNWKLQNGTGRRHVVEISGTAEVLEYEITPTINPAIKQWTYKIVGLKYNATYTLTFTGGNGVAVAV